MVLWVFDGNMVGKWTNEPCNGVDEVVNPFWVLTPGSMIMSSLDLIDTHTSSGGHLKIVFQPFF